MKTSLTSRLLEKVAQLERADDAMRQGAELVRDRAEMRAPDAPPYGEGLKRSVHVNDSGAPLDYAVVAGDDDAFYGHLVEFGTSHSAPHPFLVPAYEESKDEIVRMVKKASIG